MKMEQAVRSNSLPFSSLNGTRPGGSKPCCLLLSLFWDTVCTGCALISWRKKKIRNQLASDLHDDLGSTLNSIKGAQQPLMEKENLNTFQAISSKAHKMPSTAWRHGILSGYWMIRKTHSVICSQGLHNLHHHCFAKAAILRVCSFGRWRNKKKPGWERKKKRNLYLIIKETINNSLKYAGCKKFHSR